MSSENTILVTKPALPPLKEFQPYLETIWENGWLTNNGPMHQQLERELARYLGVKYISLFSNGTLALISALQALGIKGEVITTPYSFVATTHSLWWNGIKPVFVDIDPLTFNLDPRRIEAAITSQTTAIMPVHVYGNPCQTEEIRRIADRHGLKVIYDAAHAFGVTVNGNSLLEEGDLSILSFHATKVYSTIEGGAIVCHDEQMKHHIDNLKNFGFRGETVVEEPGINAKLNEVQAAYGLLSLRYVDGYIDKRKAVADRYRRDLEGLPGITVLHDIPGVRHAYPYFPILIDEALFGCSRDALYEALKERHIFSRRYFYPLITDFDTYRSLPSAQASNLPVANEVARKVLCLPIYPELTDSDQSRVIESIKNCFRR
jgi:dTDP-4-amino-4,6-dideoxygalactose transaminase